MDNVIRTYGDEPDFTSCKLSDGAVKEIIPDPFQHASPKDEIFFDNEFIGCRRKDVNRARLHRPSKASIGSTHAFSQGQVYSLETTRNAFSVSTSPIPGLFI